MILFVVWEWYSCSTQMIKSTRKSTLVPAPESQFRGCTPHLFQSSIFPCSDFLLHEIQNKDFGNMHGKYKKYMKCLLFHPNLWTAHSTFPNIVSSPIRLCNVLSSWFVLQMLFLKIKMCREIFASQEFIACQKKKRSVAWRTAVLVSSRNWIKEIQFENSRNTLQQKGRNIAQGGSGAGIKRGLLVGDKPLTELLAAKSSQMPQSRQDWKIQGSR